MAGILHLTDSQLSIAVDLAYDPVTGTWRGSVAYAYPGHGSCPAKTVTIRYVLDNTANLTISWNQVANCPDDGGTAVNFTAALGSLACGPFAGLVSYGTELPRVDGPPDLGARDWLVLAGADPGLNLLTETAAAEPPDQALQPATRPDHLVQLRYAAVRPLLPAEFGGDLIDESHDSPPLSDKWPFARNVG